VHEVAVHPANGEIVLATHGRSLWACDVTALRSLRAPHLDKDIAFHKPKDVVRWRTQPRRGRTNRRFVAENPRSGAHLWYSLPAPAKQVRLRVENIEGQLVSDLKGETKPGLHRVIWNMTRTAAPQRPPAEPQSPGGPGAKPGSGQPTPGPATGKPPAESEEGSAGEKPSDQPSAEPKETPKRRRRSSGRPRRSREEASGKPAEQPAQMPGTTETAPQPRVAVRTGPPSGGRTTGPVPNGTYRVTLVVDGREVQSHTVSLKQDPGLPPDAISDEVYEALLQREQSAQASKSRDKAEGREVRDDD
jgi:hypothetical protein